MDTMITQACNPFAAVASILLIVACLALFVAALTWGMNHIK
jgi:hypothetical protein